MPPILAHELTYEQVQELKDAFDRYDLDSSGTLSASEMRLALISMGHEITEAELYDLIRTVTVRDDTELNLAQFMQMMAPRMADIDSDEALERAFKLIDRDHDGFIGGQDVRAIMLILGEVVTDEDVRDICRAVDMDGDGHISLLDFMSFMHSPL
ncbi:calmodulin [Drosophila subpulchrella]|uniref:calmodulin n=1 Tax=Drosophila subpulchrella TaxID=1486046 RepID=UPI0018A17EA2|nr:calmodulin [Drosophila subpulchrella]XP_037713367.1 calmodulin [Drosophila subpulchrella]